MNDDDLIWRADAMHEIDALGLPYVFAVKVEEAIAALPAAQADYEARIRAALDVAPTANCVICGRLVDTREKAAGGDGHGCEYPEGWVCSDFCAEQLHPDPDWMVEEPAALEPAPATTSVRTDENVRWWNGMATAAEILKEAEQRSAAMREAGIAEGIAAWEARNAASAKGGE